MKAVIVLILFLSSCCYADEPNFSEFLYRADRDPNQIVITNYTGSNAVVNIPSAIHGYDVIGFEGPAFNGCTNLTAITIPNSVWSIWGYGFVGCTNLKSINIPEGVSFIGGEAFIHCRNLTAITVAPANANFSSIAGVLFNKSQTRLLDYPIGKTGTYRIPEGVSNIGYEAFEYRLNLGSITIPDSVTFIEAGAFGGCSNLASIYFKGHAPELGEIVFAGATKATIYYLPTTTGWGKTFGGRPTAVWKQ